MAIDIDKAVEARIRELLAPNANFPKGRRSFEAISNAIGSFDTKSDELREHLVRVGAIRNFGKRKKEYWTMVDNAGDLSRAASPPHEQPTLSGAALTKDLSASENDSKNDRGAGGGGQNTDNNQPQSPTILQRITSAKAIVGALTGLVIAIFVLKGEICKFDFAKSWCEPSNVIPVVKLQNLDAIIDNLKVVNDKKVSDYE